MPSRLAVPRRTPGEPRTFSAYVTMAVAAVALVFALVFFLLFLGGWKSVPVDKVALHYTGGPVQGTHFKEVVAPGTHTRFYGLLEKLYELPSTQRNYIISKTPGEGDVKERDFIAAPSKDSVNTDWEVATYFKLNTHRRVVRRFFENICLKYHCWDLSDHGGWDRMLSDNFRQQIVSAIQAEARNYNVNDLYANRDVLLKIQSEVGDQLKERVSQVLGGEYFCGPTFSSVASTCPDFSFIIKGVTVPDNIRSQYEANKASALAIQTKTNEVEQAKQQALAAAELNKAISNNPNYVLLKAIESGKITFWVLPSGNNFTLQTPPASGP